LRALVQLLSRHWLGRKDVEPDILGRAYEYLIRKFAEGQRQSAGEFYTPREAAVLTGRILDPKPGEKIYSPAWGSSPEDPEHVPHLLLHTEAPHAMHALSPKGAT
jgi:type I restriction enzyme M protein